MSSILNEVRITGYVGLHPECKRTENGEMMTFTICINEKFKKGNTMVSKKPVWINCICFHEARVRYLKENLKEGIFIQIRGSLSSNNYSSNKYFDDDGKPANIEKINVVVDDFILMPKRNNVIDDIGYDENLQI